MSTSFVVYICVYFVNQGTKTAKIAVIIGQDVNSLLMWSAFQNYH